MPRETLLLSIRPTFVERIIDGTKTAELRRVRPTVRPGQDVLIYGSSPTMLFDANAERAQVLFDIRFFGDFGVRGRVTGPVPTSKRHAYGIDPATRRKVAATDEHNAF